MRFLRKVAEKVTLDNTTRILEKVNKHATLIARVTLAMIKAISEEGGTLLGLS